MATIPIGENDKMEKMETSVNKLSASVKQVNFHANLVNTLSREQQLTGQLNDKVAKLQELTESQGKQIAQMDHRLSLLVEANKVLLNSVMPAIMAKLELKTETKIKQIKKKTGQNSGNKSVKEPESGSVAKNSKSPKLADSDKPTNSNSGKRPASQDFAVQKLKKVKN